MDDLQVKIDQLEKEMQQLGGSAPSTMKAQNIALIIGIVVPFVIFALLYITAFDFCKTDDEVDRKKVLKWSLLSSVVVWIGLFVYASIKSRQGE